MSFSFKKYMESTGSSDFGGLVEQLKTVSDVLTDYKNPVYEEMILPFQYAGDYLIEHGNDIKGKWLHSFIPILQRRIDGYTDVDPTIQLNKWNRTLSAFCRWYKEDRFFGFYNHKLRPQVYQEFILKIPFNPFESVKGAVGLGTSFAAHIKMPVDRDIVNNCRDSSMGVNQYSRTIQETGLCSLDISKYFTRGSFSFIDLFPSYIHEDSYRVLNPVDRYYDGAERIPSSIEYRSGEPVLMTNGGFFSHGNRLVAKLKPEVMEYIGELVNNGKVYGIGSDIEDYASVYAYCTEG